MSSLTASLLIGAVAAALFLVPRLRAAAERRAAGVIDLSESLRALSLGAYLRSSTLAAWTKEHLRNVRWSLGPVRSMSLPAPVRRAYHTAAAVLNDPPKWAASRNRDFVETEVKNLDAWFASRLGHPLTNAQSQAVVTDEDTTLVVAGAGAGKTSTLLAKVAYLIEHRGESPDSILILAFNASVADELRERVDRLDLPRPEIATFHGKGFDILGQAEGRKPAVSALARDDRALLSLVQDEFERTLADRKRRKEFERWWVSLRVSPKSLEECETPDERLRYEMALGLRTLTGVKVASIAEVKVADWLTLNDVDWEYERRYPHTPPSSKKREYTPDFFLPTKNAWLEVWSCDRSEERFPPELDRDAYVEGMQWKRDLHRAHGTTLVELFQDEVWGPNPELHLSEVLDLEDDTGATHPELGEHLRAVRATTAPFVMLLTTFLRLFRAGGWTRRNVEERAATKRDSAFLQIFWPFLERYEEELASESKIDFDTMLIEAAALTRDGAYQSRYRYLLVDEFQDTSGARMRLIQALRGDRSDCRVFAVGDDWQAIYRFAGSDVDYFTRIENYLGPTARVILPDTFRLVSDVASLSSRFVLENPQQLEKELAPRTHGHQGPAVLIHLHAQHGEGGLIQEILDEIAERTPGGRVLVLARYRFRLDVIQEVRLPRDLQIEATTVHRSKGLEADEVLVLGVDAGTFGFPTEIQDDEVLRLLLEGEEEHPNAEERRLFYVALTRTRSRVHLLADRSNPSRFVEELARGSYGDWTEFRGKGSERHPCPRCRGTTIESRNGPYGSFWACTHYPACDGRLPTCPSCGQGAVLVARASSPGGPAACTSCEFETTTCPQCEEGLLVERTGPYGQFMGCTAWRSDGSGCGFNSDLPTDNES